MSTSISLFDLKPGKVLDDRFEILRTVRQGGMSVALEVREGEEVSELQVFPAGLFESPAQAAEFAAALAEWRAVESPAILRVRDAYAKPDGTLLFLTELPQGASLRRWLDENGTLDVATALRLGLRLLDGLVDAHARELVHGDVKPYTIHLVDGDPDSAVLVDGGITTGLWSAKHLGDKTALIGTPVYAPAEQFGGDSPDVQSDIYNLATVLFESVAGVVPWRGSTFLEIFQSKLDKSTPSLRSAAPDADVSAEVERAIVTGLLVDKRERYSSAEEFRDALRAVAE